MRRDPRPNVEAVRESLAFHELLTSHAVNAGIISDDGKQIWDGTSWRLVSDDRQWWWDGNAWQPTSGLLKSIQTNGASVQAPDEVDAEPQGSSALRDGQDENEPDVEIQAAPDAGYRLSPTSLIVSPGGQWWWNGAKWNDLVKKPSEARPTPKGPKLGFGQVMQMATTAQEVKKAITSKGSLSAVEAEYDARNRAREAHLNSIQGNCPLPVDPLIRPLPGGLQLFPDEFLVTTAKDWGWSSQRLTLTTHRLIYTRGRASKAVESMYLQDIRDVKYIKPFMGFGKLGIENAAGVSSLEGLPAMANAAKMRNDIMTMVHFARQRGQAPVAAASAVAAEDIPAKIKQLADLRSAGILTEEEFQAKKTDLLKRL